MSIPIGPMSPATIPGLLERLGISPSNWQYTMAEVLAARWFPHTDPAIPLIVDAVRPHHGHAMVTALTRAYPASHGVWIMAREPAHAESRPAPYNLADAGEVFQGGGSHVLAVPPLAEDCSLTQLPNILARLRAPGGCPRNREKTLESQRFHVASEVHEVIEAIDLQDDENLVEELGDLLMNTFFLSTIGYEQGRFHLNDVLSGISRKMIRRHPHVFEDLQLADSNSVRKMWEHEYRARGKKRSPLDGITKGLPALEDARLMQSSFRKTGTEPDVHAAAINESAEPDPELELGQRLWCLVAEASEAGLNPEDALRRFNSLYRQSVQGSDRDAPCRADKAFSRGDTMPDSDQNQRN
jgi:tetrapyrrole methylase family protein/MazG family protein